jgi:hypothetical protein
MQKIKCLIATRQWHVKGVAEGFPRKFDSIELGLWISRYGFISVNDTLCKIKCQK